jgi:hypothetical protein
MAYKAGKMINHSVVARDNLNPMVQQLVERIIYIRNSRFRVTVPVLHMYNSHVTVLDVHNSHVTALGVLHSHITAQFDFGPADRTSVIALQPRLDASPMENVLCSNNLIIPNLKMIVCKTWHLSFATFSFKLKVSKQVVH